MSVLTLAEAKAHLNITDSTSDAELQTFIDAAEAAIAARVGPLGIGTSTTARVSGGGRVLLLPDAPVATLTSVTPTGGTTALTLTDLYLDQMAGTVAYTSDASFTAFWYDVVFVPGRAVTPPDLLMADKELLRHMWGTQRPDGGRFSSGAQLAAANTIPGAAYLFPFRVEALLAPYLPGIGFA